MQIITVLKWIYSTGPRMMFTVRTKTSTQVHQAGDSIKTLAIRIVIITGLEVTMKMIDSRSSCILMSQVIMIFIYYWRIELQECRRSVNSQLQKNGLKQ